MAALILIGRQGHFPLFQHAWPQHLPNRPLAPSEERQAWRIFKKLAQYPSLERKKNIFQQLNKEDQALFIHSFLQLIANLAWAEHEAVH
ncbi:MAG: hypothetical protein J6Y94_05755 [Bacteriovoracaceae bacterium]|nr:hypothetical protein [Bacteriovoracaceae bacterium]